MSTYEKVKEATDFIKSKVDFSPTIAIICGSGLSGIGNILQDSITIKYQDIPSFVTSSVEGHKSQLVVGRIGSKQVVCMQGRFHPYEGYPAWVPGFPVRVFKMLGCETVIITNAAGGINREFNVGDLMLIKDHISFPSLSGYNPLTGPNDDHFGVRFPSMLNVYDAELRTKMRECALKLGYESFLREGVYTQVAGPSYETIAELRLLQTVGSDAVGMSTVQEVVAARHCGMKVVACSLVTNKCIMEYDTESTISHAEVLETAAKRGLQMEALISMLCEQI